MTESLRLFWHPSSGTLHHGGMQFDPWRLAWAEAQDATTTGGEPIDAVEAVRRLYAARVMRRVPLAVIGPKKASAEQVAIAEALGRAIGAVGFPLLTGGKNGVMEATCRGCHAEGGEPIALIPDEDWTCANAYVVTPLATGIGPARNVLIARAAFVLIAVGGEYGTLSEMAFGMHFDKVVLSLADAPYVAGAIVCADVQEAIARAALALLGLPQSGHPATT